MKTITDKMPMVKSLIILLFACLIIWGQGCSRKHTPASKPVPEVADTATNVKMYPMQNLVLKIFLDSLKVVIENHDWEKFLANCDSSHRYNQLDVLKMPVSQYIAEMLGLHSSGNDIAKGYEVTTESINRIRAVDFGEVFEYVGSTEVKGTVSLTDGRTLYLTIILVLIQDKYFLNGGVG